MMTYSDKKPRTHTLYCSTTFQVPCKKRLPQRRKNHFKIGWYVVYEMGDYFIYIIVVLFFNISTTWCVSLLVDQWVPRAHAAKFYGRLRLIHSVLRASTFSVLKLIEIVILWVYYTIPFGFSLFLHFRTIIFSF